MRNIEIKIRKVQANSTTFLSAREREKEMIRHRGSDSIATVTTMTNIEIKIGKVQANSTIFEREIEKRKEKQSYSKHCNRYGITLQAKKELRSRDINKKNIYNDFQSIITGTNTKDGINDTRKWKSTISTTYENALLICPLQVTM